MCLLLISAVQLHKSELWLTSSLERRTDEIVSKCSVELYCRLWNLKTLEYLKFLRTQKSQFPIHDYRVSGTWSIRNALWSRCGHRVMFTKEAHSEAVNHECVFCQFFATRLKVLSQNGCNNRIHSHSKLIRRFRSWFRIELSGPNCGSFRFKVDIRCRNWRHLLILRQPCVWKIFLSTCKMNSLSPSLVSRNARSLAILSTWGLLHWRDSDVCRCFYSSDVRPRDA